MSLNATIALSLVISGFFAVITLYPETRDSLLNAMPIIGAVTSLLFIAGIAAYALIVVLDDR